LVASIGNAAWRRAAGSAARIATRNGISHQGFVARRGGELDDRLEGSPVADILDYVMCDVRLCDVCGHIELECFCGHFDDFVRRADFQCDINRWQVTHLYRQFTLDGSECFGRDRTRVFSRRKIGEAVVAARVCLDLFGPYERTPLDSYQSMRDNRPGLIFDQAL